MARRQTRNITGIRGTGAVDANTVWRVFECSQPGCDQLMKVSEDWIENQLTSIEYGLLSGPPSLNPRAVDAILRDVDGFIERWMRYPDDLKKIRQLILDMNGVDIFTQATTVPDFLR